QALAGKLDERVFERRALEVDIGEIEAVSVDPLHQVDQGARWMAGLYGKLPAVLAEDRVAGVSPGQRAAVGQGLFAADFDHRMAQRARLNLMRGADRNNAAFIDDGHAVAQLLRFFNIVRSDE